MLQPGNAFRPPTILGMLPETDEEIDKSLHFCANITNKHLKVMKMVIYKVFSQIKFQSSFRLKIEKRSK